MSDYLKHMVNKIDNNPLWEKIIFNYNKHWINREGEQKIPKKIHQIWFGSELPDRYKKLSESFIKKNPEWEYKLWTDKDVNGFGMKNYNIFKKLNNLGSKSDIFRYEVLDRFGGVYFDTDFICVKPLDDFLHLDFFSATGHVDMPEVFNGMIGSKPNHPMLKELIEGLANINIDYVDYETIMNITGPKFFSKIFFNYLEKSNEKIIMFPTKFFYSFPAVNRFNYDMNFVKSFLVDESYCVHLWDTSWQKK